jgi:hypothetical protein
LLERDQEALQCLRLRIGAQHRQPRGRDAGKPALVGDVLAPGLGGVEHGVGKFGGKPRELDADLAETAACRLLEGHAGEPEVAQGMLDERARRPGQRREVRRRGQGLDRGVELAVLAQFQRMLGDRLLGLAVGRAQGLAVGHRVQVRHRRPDLVEAHIQPLLRQHHVREVARRRGRGELGDAGAVLGQAQRHRRHDVFGADGGKGRQRCVGEQRIGGGHRIRGGHEIFLKEMLKKARPVIFSVRRVTETPRAARQASCPDGEHREISAHGANALDGGARRETQVNAAVARPPRRRRRRPGPEARRPGPAPPLAGRVR